MGTRHNQCRRSYHQQNPGGRNISGPTCRDAIFRGTLEFQGRFREGLPVFRQKLKMGAGFDTGGAFFRRLFAHV